MPKYRTLPTRPINLIKFLQRNLRNSIFRFFCGNFMKTGKLPVFGQMHAAFYVTILAHWLIDWLVGLLIGFFTQHFWSRRKKKRRQRTFPVRFMQETSFWGVFVWVSVFPSLLYQMPSILYITGVNSEKKKFCGLFCQNSWATYKIEMGIVHKTGNSSEQNFGMAMWTWTGLHCIR